MGPLFSSQRLEYFEASVKDIDYIIELENKPENSLYVWQGTFEQHKQEIEDKNHLLLIHLEKSSKEKIGYSLSRIDRKSNIFELRRIVIDNKAQGFGRESIIATLKYAFEKLDINKFWLDVYPDNSIGISLYESIGFHKDGVLRENYKSKRGYLDQIVYSILAREYIKLKEIW